ncbi:MAG: RidA family protein [Candidatus Hydrogenedentes bacterium]|nr:RidA family protein [Candidatus Hydrogenedentota bacterium]
MQKRCFSSPNSAPAGGPYSPAVAAGDLLFVSGQVPFARDGSGYAPGTFEEELRRTLDNLKTVLEDAGSGMAHVVKTQVFLADMAKFAEFNAIYQEYFPSEQPARTTIQPGQMPKGMQVEIDAIAVLPG